MGALLKLVPTSFILGAIAGPLAMFLFQYIKKLGGIIDARPAWEKNMYMFVLCQVVGVIATLAGQDIKCTVDMTASACVAQFTPNVLKAIVTQVGAVLAFKLKKMPSA